MSVLSAEGVPATAKSRPGAPSFNVKQSSKDQGKDKAPPSRHQWSRMMTMPRPRRGSVRSEPNFQEGEWEVPNGYDYSKPTSGNYAIPAEPSTESRDDELHGSYQAVRASRDFDYHGIYSRERQLFQDSLVSNVVGASSEKDHPWIVFTAGAMGAGKSHTINWMSEMGYFPLPDIVTVDPDLFKTAFPEWQEYVRRCPGTAGSLTRRESGYLVEVAQETAMKQRKNVWVDGSLRDSKWYEYVFEEIRKNHPVYRIAILYVHANEVQVLERAKRRAELTGRVVPVEEIKDSLYRVPRTVAILMPKTDFVAHIKNDGDHPTLTAFYDRSGSHRNVLGAWTEVKDRFATLPEFREGSMWKSIVEHKISSPGVLIYSKTYCSFCAKIKALMRHLKIPFRVEELDKTQGGAAMQLVLASRPASRCPTVPQLFASGEFIGGCSDALVMHVEGKLEPRLRKAAAEALPGGEAELPPPVGREDENGPEGSSGGRGHRLGRSLSM